MPTWGNILGEIRSTLATNPAALDEIRKKYIKELADYTGRNTIVYFAKWTTNDVPANLISVNDEDMQGFMEAAYGLQGENLDLILHTGGGSGESTEAIVNYLRQKFSNIRVIVPQAAMSAGTMLACSADVIVMGKQSSLGPIDPQFIINTQFGPQAFPAHSIMEQFKRAQDKILDNPKKIASWMPTLQQCGPALLIRCENQIQFGEELIKSWLTKYMFNGDAETASKIATHLSDHANFKTHGKHISVVEAEAIGLKVAKLEDDQILQDKVLSAYHAIMHTFGMTGACKIIANQNGNSYVKLYNVNINVPQVLRPQTIPAPPQGIN